MKWTRAYYRDTETMIESGRSFVWDGRNQHDDIYWADDGDYWQMMMDADDDLIVCEWDIAVSREVRRKFEAYCVAEPDRVHVAPYKHYYFKTPDTEYSYLVRKDLDRFCDPLDTHAMLFGFGLTYIPLRMMKECLEDLSQEFPVEIPYELRTKPGATLQYPAVLSDMKINDVIFSMWHWYTQRQMVPVHWDCEPVHLNYEDETRPPSAVITPSAVSFVPFS